MSDAIIGSFSYDASKVLLSAEDARKRGVFVPEGKASIWVQTTDAERIERQMTVNGARLLAAHDGAQWESVLSDGIIDINVGTTAVVKGIDVPENILYDGSPLQSWSGTLVIPPTTFNDDGVLTYSGLRPEAINEISFRVSQTAYDASGQALLDSKGNVANHWVCVHCDTASDVEQNFAFQFKPSIFEWIPDDGIFTPKTHRTGLSRGKRDVTAQFTIGRTSRLFRKIECVEDPANPGFFIVTFWFYVGNTRSLVTAQVAPLDLDGELQSRTVPVAGTNRYQYVSSPGLVGFRFVSFLVVRHSDIIQDSQIQIPPSLTTGIDDIRRNLLAVQTLANSTGAQVDTMRGVPGTGVDPGQPTFVDGKIYMNTTAARITLPAVVNAAEIAKIAGLELYAGAVKRSDGLSVADNDAAFTGPVPEGVILGYSTETFTHFYKGTDGNWTEEPPKLEASGLPKWNYIKQEASAFPVAVVRNHGKTTISSKGSAYVDEGRIWQKLDSADINFPLVRLDTAGSGPLLPRGDTYIAALAVETVNRATTTFSLRIQGGAPVEDAEGNVTIPMVGIGTHSEFIDGDRTILLIEIDNPVGNSNNWVRPSLTAVPGQVQGPVFYTKGQDQPTFLPVEHWEKYQKPDGTFEDRKVDSGVIEELTALRARKEVVDHIVTTTTVSGDSLPATTDLPGPTASGFSNDGSGPVAGATSWFNNGPIGIDISQAGLADDEFEISFGFGAAVANTEFNFRVGAVFQKYRTTGIDPGPLDITEFRDGTWRGATLRVTGPFTGQVIPFQKITYIGPCVRRIRKQGFAVENKPLALVSDLTDVSNSVTALNAKLAGLLNLEAKPGIDVPAGDPTWFDGAWWYNKSGTIYTLPNTITDAVLIAAKFVKSSAAIAAGVAADIVAGTSADAVQWSAKEIKSAITSLASPAPASGNSTILTAGTDATQRTWTAETLQALKGTALSLANVKATVDGAANWTNAGGSSGFTVDVPANPNNQIALSFTRNRTDGGPQEKYRTTIDVLLRVKQQVERTRYVVADDPIGWAWHPAAAGEVLFWITTWGGKYLYLRTWWSGNRITKMGFTDTVSSNWNDWVIEYDSPVVHRLTFDELNSDTSTVAGIADGKTANEWLKARNPSAADVTALLRKTDAATLYAGASALATTNARVKALEDKPDPVTDVSGLATKIELADEATARADGDTALSVRVKAIEDAPPPVAFDPASINAAVAAEVKARTDGDTALGTRIKTVEDRPSLAASPSKSYSFAAYRGGTVIAIGAGSPSWTDIRFTYNEPGYSAANLLTSGDVVIPRAGRVLVESKWWNTSGSDERATLLHKDSAGTIKASYPNMLATIPRVGQALIILNAAAGDRLNWQGSSANNIYWAEHHTELRVTSYDDVGGGFVVPSGNQVLTPRAITGNGTGTGYDGVPVPVKIEVTAGHGLLTVAATGGATVSGIDPLANTCLVTVNGAATVLSHTSAPRQTFTGLQRVSSVSTVLALTTTATDYDTGTTLLAGDLLEISHTFSNSVAESTMLWVRVSAGSTQRAFPWPDATNHQTIFDFPSTLTSKFKVRQSSGNSGPRIIAVKVWRDAANGYVVPSGTVARTACLVTAGGKTWTLFGGTSGRISVDPESGNQISSATGTPGLTVSIADPISGALEVAVEEGTTTGTITTSVTSLAGGAYSTSETATGQQWIDGKQIYKRTWTGTTPNNGSDNALFAIPTGAAFLRMEGYVAQSVGSRRVSVEQAQSGNTTHGPLVQWYPSDNSIHAFNATGDGRWQNMPYAITVFYTK